MCINSILRYFLLLVLKMIIYLVLIILYTYHLFLVSKIQSFSNIQVHIVFNYSYHVLYNRSLEFNLTEIVSSRFSLIVYTCRLQIFVCSFEENILSIAQSIVVLSQTRLKIVGFKSILHFSSKQIQRFGLILCRKYSYHKIHYLTFY